MNKKRKGITTRDRSSKKINRIEKGTMMIMKIRRIYLIKIKRKR